MYKEFRQKLQENFAILATGLLFYVSINRDEVWERYLSTFPDSIRQEHNCNSCKSFLRQYGGIVAITADYKMKSIWDGVEVPDEFKAPVKALKDYVHSLPVTNVFLSDTRVAGTAKNYDAKRDVWWEHYALEIPKTHTAPSHRIDTDKAQARDTKQVFARGLNELTLDSTEIVLELIAQNSLYNSNQFKASIEAFRNHQKAYKLLQPEQKELYCWLESRKTHMSVARLRNSAIGTLLIDLSEDVDVDEAVRKYSRSVMAPTNYMRSQSVATPKMLQAAKEDLQALGLLPALERRYATDTDVSASAVLFKHTPQRNQDVFAQLANETTVNPKTFSKVEEVGIQDFIQKVLPSAKMVDVLVEPNHLPNFVSLTAPVDQNAPNLFKWNNPYGWNYTGSVADSIQERVKAAGGDVEAKLRISLSWSNYDDLDLHVFPPIGNEIWYSVKYNSKIDGSLDVDMNAGGGHTRVPVENVAIQNPVDGRYEVKVVQFSKREAIDQGYTVQVAYNGEIYEFYYQTNVNNKFAFNFSNTDGIKFIGATPNSSNNVIGKEKWNVKTGVWTRVKQVLLSPNHWEGEGVGNKHYFFILNNCVSDEEARPFFNEFLRSDILTHRKTLEMVANKMTLEQTNNQLSGIGFSETIRKQLVVKVTGSFERVLKVNF